LPDLDRIPTAIIATQPAPDPALIGDDEITVIFSFFIDERGARASR